MPKDRPQNRNLRPNPHTLGVTPLAEGERSTKPIRFRLPEELADRLETMPADERNALATRMLSQEERF